ncbi:hypothetical protein LEM8419_02601 [Neolewinella maritima]|uniref:Capsule assembly Wzi family protein n=1 Tax=Neolewinella maritima TaxID=1383882 RepID=A0ABM9B3B0_9BACT|nr:hypothetical protein [Neolewinella maritima]CAH1001695.1 hypothetical protein LEM8419_02601 [Neolewinella maritima]
MRVLLVCILLTAPLFLAAQGAPLPVNEEGYDLMQRLYIKYGTEGFTAPAADLNLRPASRGDLVRLAKTYEALHGDEMSKAERYRLQRFFDNNNEWLSLPTFEATDDADRAPFYIGDSFALASVQSPLYRRSRKPIVNTFYKTPAHLLAYDRKDFYLRLNPVLDLRYGQLQNDEQSYLYNKRGVRLRAGIDDRFFLHFEILDTQFGAPDYLRNYFRRVGSLPGAGLVKDELTIESFNIVRGYDFLNGAGYLSADLTQHVGIRLGYGQHFIGSGERSLFLSDFSNNYPFLEINWRIWKFHYRNIFAELTDGPQTVPGGNTLYPKKYLAAHYLSLNIGKRLSVGLFEAVVLNREKGFDLAYLNPIILYRTVEGSLGSPDNVVIGLTASYRLPLRTEVYGQFILDEFVFSELFIKRDGWWANKWAYQIGARHVDAFGVDQLDLVVERNTARPYIYSHDGPSSYTHFAMPLAHPLGANFTENLVGLDYRPLPRLHLSGRAYLIEQGEGIDSTVVGENLNQSSDLREMTYGNEIGQGIGYTNTILQLRAGYEIRPNLWLEAEYFRRSKNSERDERDLETTLLNVGVRWNVTRRREAF